MTKISSGKIVNLLSNDSSQIELALYFVNYIWVRVEVFVEMLDLLFFL